MRYDGDRYTLEGGRTIYANRGTLGLCDNGRLHEGYDGVVHEDMTPEVASLIGEKALTAEEKAEIAKEMIRRWREWAGLPEEFTTIVAWLRTAHESDCMSPMAHYCADAIERGDHNA